IKGNITDFDTNEAVPFAQLLIKSINKEAVTNEDGEYFLKSIPVGTYTIELYMLGYQRIQVKVKVNTGKSTTLNLAITPEVTVINEVTISATKLSNTVKTIGAPVYVIGKHEMEQVEGRNIEEALTMVPGVFTEDRFHGGANVVSFRGVGLHTHVTRGILVLVDGVSINEAMGRVSFEGIDMQNAEKVEIIKGPVSALYGPNGITGVINIVGRAPQEGLHGNIKAGGGSFGSKQLSANLNGSNGKFSYLVKGNYVYSDGYQNRSVYDNKNFGVKLGYDFKNLGSFRFGADYILSDAQYPGPLDSAQYFSGSRESGNKYTGSDKILTRINLSHEKKWQNNFSLFSNLYFRGRLDDGHYRDSMWGHDDLKLFGGEVRAQHIFDIHNDKNMLSAGIKFDNEIGYQSNYLRDTDTGEVLNMVDDGESIYQMFGAYIQDEYTFYNKLTLNVGLRYDIVNYKYDDLFDSTQVTQTNSISAFSPKIGLAFNPKDNLTIYANYGQGFNPPQISQLFIGSAYSGRPNPDLKPEYLTNIEVGVRGDIAQKLQYQLSFFNMNFKDQIVGEGDPPYYENVGDTQHSGIEAYLEYQIMEGLSAYVVYSYLYTVFLNNPDYEGNTLRKTPANQLGTGIRYNTKFGTTLSIDYKFMDKYYMDNDNVNVYDGHSLLNAKVIQRWKSLFASLRVDNILDANYATWAYASQEFNPATRQMEWEKSYYPGWTTSFSISLGYSF
ncbi:MAG: hypothetical protein DRI71_02875, partial [Bacteroidetes bacterium]